MKYRGHTGLDSTICTGGGGGGIVLEVHGAHRAALHHVQGGWGGAVCLRCRERTGLHSTL